MSDVPQMRMDHVGIAVESIEDGERLLFALGCEKIHVEESDDGRFTWATYVLGDASRLELVAPKPGTESFLTAFLEEKGPGLHHITLEVADIDAAVRGLEAQGYQIVDRAAFDHWAEAFISPSNPGSAHPANGVFRRVRRAQTGGREALRGRETARRWRRGR